MLCTEQDITLTRNTMFTNFDTVGFRVSMYHTAMPQQIASMLPLNFENTYHQLCTYLPPLSDLVRSLCPKRHRGLVLKLSDSQGGVKLDESHSFQGSMSGSVNRHFSGLLSSSSFHTWRHASFDRARFLARNPCELMDRMKGWHVAYQTSPYTLSQPLDILTGQFGTTVDVFFR